MNLLPIEQLNDETTILKYKIGSKVVNNIMDQLINKIKIGSSIRELADETDVLLLKKLKDSNQLKTKCNIGLSFPTCISINNQAGYFRPTLKDDIIIKDGDLVKIEMGVHIDGFPSVLGYTKLVSKQKISPDDKRAKVLNATSEASKEILQNMTTEKSNQDIVKILEIIANKYDVNLLYSSQELKHMPGTMSFQVSQNILDSKIDDDDLHKIIVNRDSDAYDFVILESFFEGNEVYVIDIAYSSGTGKIKVSTKESTIFKRTDARKNLRLDISKKILSKFNTPFPMNASDYLDNPKTKLGVNDCFRNDLLEVYPAMEESHGEYVSRIIFTVIVKKPNKENDEQNILLTGRSSDQELQKIDNKNILN